MGNSVNDAANLSVTMFFVAVVTGILFTMSVWLFQANRVQANKVAENTSFDYGLDLEAMSEYGKSLPCPNIVATLYAYGNPAQFTFKVDGNSYEGIDKIVKLNDYFGRKFYVTTVRDDADALHVLVSDVR